MIPREIYKGQVSGGWPEGPGQREPSPASSCSAFWVAGWARLSPQSTKARKRENVARARYSLEKRRAYFEKTRSVSVGNYSQNSVLRDTPRVPYQGASGGGSTDPQ